MTPHTGTQTTLRATSVASHASHVVGELSKSIVDNRVRGGSNALMAVRSDADTAHVSLSSTAAATMAAPLGTQDTTVIEMDVDEGR